MMATKEPITTKTQTKSPDFSSFLERSIPVPDTPTTMSRSEWEHNIKKIVRFKGRRAHLRLVDGSIIPNVGIIGIYPGRHSFIVKYRSPFGIRSLPVIELESIEVFSPMPRISKRRILR